MQLRQFAGLSIADMSDEDLLERWFDNGEIERRWLKEKFADHGGEE